MARRGMSNLGALALLCCVIQGIVILAMYLWMRGIVAHDDDKDVRATERIAIALEALSGGNRKSSQK